MVEVSKYQHTSTFKTPVVTFHTRIVVNLIQGQDGVSIHISVTITRQGRTVMLQLIYAYVTLPFKSLQLMLE